MGTLVKDARGRSQFWYYAYRDANGRRLKKSTKETDRRKAKPGAGKSGLSMAFKRIMDKAGIAAGVIRERGGPLAEVYLRSAFTVCGTASIQLWLRLVSGR